MDILIELMEYTVLTVLAVAAGYVALLALAWAAMVVAGLLALPFVLIGKAFTALRGGVTWIDPSR